MKELDTAIEIIGNRRADNRLVTRAAQILGGAVPPPFSGNEVAVCYTPYVAGGTNAELAFIREVAAAGAPPILASYEQDRYTVANAFKVNSWRPRLALPNGRMTKQWIVAPERRADTTDTTVGGAPTVYGVSVAAYQNKLAVAAMCSAGLELPYRSVDFSDWYGEVSTQRGQARSAAAYYPAILAAYAVFGVMYRYDTNRTSNAEFRQRVTDPACEYIREKLGVDPIIVSRPYPADGMVTDLRNLDDAEVYSLQNYGTIKATSI